LEGDKLEKAAPVRNLFLSSCQYAAFLLFKVEQTEAFLAPPSESSL